LGVPVRLFVSWILPPPTPPLDAAEDDRVVELSRLSGVDVGAVERGEHLVVRGSVHRHLGQLDRAVLDGETGTVLEGRPQEVVAELRDHHPGDLPAGKAHPDADLVVVEDGVVAGVDGGRAVVLDTQQDQRRILKPLAVLLQLLERATNHIRCYGRAPPRPAACVERSGDVHRVRVQPSPGGQLTFQPARTGG
jgi:hypothetical protein